MKITDAIAAFLANRDGMHLASTTSRNYRSFTRQFLAFCETKGDVMLDPHHVYRHPTAS